jgi:hypothetical protein
MAYDMLPGKSAAKISPGTSMKFLAEAFAAWCDQKSRLSAARATGLIDDEAHDALLEDYARTRDRIGALLAKGLGTPARRTASADRAADGPTPCGAPPRRRCPAC